MVSFCVILCRSLIGTEFRHSGMCLSLTPGYVLHLSALLVLKRYRDRGNKAGAVKGYQLLQLGELIEIKPQRGASIVCTTVNSSCMAVCLVCTISEVPINSICKLHCCWIAYDL